MATDSCNFYILIFCLCNKSDVVLLYAYNLISIEYLKSFVKVCLFLVKTAVFQPEILTNHHGNHFHGFMA